MQAACVTSTVRGVVEFNPIPVFINVVTFNTPCSAIKDLEISRIEFLEIYNVDLVRCL